MSLYRTNLRFKEDVPPAAPERMTRLELGTLQELLDITGCATPFAVVNASPESARGKIEMAVGARLHWAKGSSRGNAAQRAEADWVLVHHELLLRALTYHREQTAEHAWGDPAALRENTKVIYLSAGKPPPSADTVRWGRVMVASAAAGGTLLLAMGALLVA